MDTHFVFGRRLRQLIAVVVFIKSRDSQANVLWCCKEEPGMQMLQLLQELMFCYAKFIRDIIKCYCLHSNRHNTLSPLPSPRYLVVFITLSLGLHTCYGCMNFSLGSSSLCSHYRPFCHFRRGRQSARAQPCCSLMLSSSSLFI